MFSSDVAENNSTVLPVLVVAVVSMILGILYVVAVEWLGQGSYAFVNQLGPGVLVATCLWAGCKITKTSALAIWSPLPWFLGACGVYFGFGPLAYYFSTSESIDFMDSLYVMDEKALLLTNLLNSAAITLICLTAAVTMKMLPLRIRRRATFNDTLTKRVMWVFLAIGGTVKYLFTLPYLMGWFSWTLPGSIQHLSNLLSSAIILLIILIFRGNRKYQWVLYPLIGTEIVSGIMMFSKLEVILTALAIVLALYLCRPNLKLLIGSAIGLVLLYALVLSPFVAFARLVVGSNSAKEAEDLGVAVSEYRLANRSNQAIFNPEIQGWWTRLSYSNVQAFAMNAYDEGASGQTIRLLPYVFIPRIVFPDKPIMGTGKEFTQLVIGEESDSHTGLGFFGEAYWNGGWAMLVIGSLYVGILYSLFGHVSIRLMASEQYAYCPIVMIGISLGLRPDDWFVPTAVGGVIEAICLYAILRGIILCLQSIPPILRPIKF